ncbi:uncharacterized protein A4U43_C01F32080 [Asparagus officinalis]|uniref:Uncharacterized protein n=1 Tax=Asparagus officinalis TaxID=4686 RepID=A0A5P1FWL8_ASPOF|nr:uncharacterized protein A4U43_C01F32080 [Asparagus officinalis]
MKYSSESASGSSKRYPLAHTRPSPKPQATPKLPNGPSRVKNPNPLRPAVCHPNPLSPSICRPNPDPSPSTGEFASANGANGPPRSATDKRSPPLARGPTTPPRPPTALTCSANRLQAEKQALEASTASATSSVSRLSPHSVPIPVVGFRNGRPGSAGAGAAHSSRWRRRGSRISSRRTLVFAIPELDFGFESDAFLMGDLGDDFVGLDDLPLWEQQFDGGDLSFLDQYT